MDALCVCYRYKRDIRDDEENINDNDADGSNDYNGRETILIDGYAKMRAISHLKANMVYYPSKESVHSVLVAHDAINKIYKTFGIQHKIYL